MCGDAWELAPFNPLHPFLPPPNPQPQATANLFSISVSSVLFVLFEIPHICESTWYLSFGGSENFDLYVFYSFLVITHNGAINIFVCVFWFIYTSIFLQCKPRRGLVGS